MRADLASRRTSARWPEPSQTADDHF
jgi:hypothetical protein